MPPISQGAFQELGEQAQNPFFIPDHPILTPAFDYKLKSYNLEDVMNAFLARQQTNYRRLTREIGQLRKGILPSNTPEEKEKRISTIRLSLHEFVVDIMVKGLQDLFRYVERAPIVSTNPGEKTVDILCQYPDLPLYVMGDREHVIHHIGRTPTTLIEVKTGSTGGAKKQLDSYRRRIGNHIPCNKLRYSSKRRRLIPYL